MKRQTPEVVSDTLPLGIADMFLDNFGALVIYGTWARETARKDPDIDLLTVFEGTDKDTRRRVDELVSKLGSRMITVVCASVDGFRKEELPLYTA